MDGMGKDQKESGDGKRSDRPYRFDLIDPRVLAEMAGVMWEGSQKGREDWGWRELGVATHLNHAMGHITAYLAGDRGNDHLSHALCRLMFAVSLDMDGEGVDLVKEMRDGGGSGSGGGNGDESNDGSDNTDYDELAKAMDRVAKEMEERSRREGPPTGGLIPPSYPTIFGDPDSSFMSRVRNHSPHMTGEAANAVIGVVGDGPIIYRWGGQDGETIQQVMPWADQQGYSETPYRPEDQEDDGSPD